MKSEMLSCWLLIVGSAAIAQGNKEATLAVRLGNNLFRTKLYDAIRKDHNKENLVVSPLSVAAVLAMSQAGARGETATAICSSSHFPEDDQLDRGYKSFMQEIQSDPHVTLEIVNRIYPAEGFPLNPQFSATLKKYFGAEPHQLNYAKNVKAAEKINAFVNASTHGKIGDLIEAKQLNARTKLVLVNAIYFKGNWEHPFPKNDTTKMDFYTSETASVEVDMMRLETKMEYGDIPELDATAVSLSYAGDHWRMIVLLPNKRTGLPEMEDKLNSISLDKIIQSMRYRKVELYLPKYKVESTIALQKPLTELGLGIIFNPAKADFSGISATHLPENLYVSEAVHKAFIEVNEEGSEAAAATFMGWGSYSLAMNTKPTPVFRVDHPFYSMIVHRQRSEDGEHTTSVFIQRIIHF